jgi:F-type H+-transporting ATPase subunit b
MFHMVNFSILISNSEVSGPGGLFDFNATLPLVAIQFVLLMLILNIILYNPLLTIIEERKEYILNNLAQASEILTQANELTSYYEQELSKVRKEGQLLVTEGQKIHKELLDIELDASQVYLDKLLDSNIEDLINKQKIALSNLDKLVESLRYEITKKLRYL